MWCRWKLPPATRTAQVIITDGQASSNDDELRNPRRSRSGVAAHHPQARSVELTIELSATLRSAGIPMPPCW